MAATTYVYHSVGNAPYVAGADAQLLCIRFSIGARGRLGELLLTDDQALEAAEQLVRHVRSRQRRAASSLTGGGS